MICCVRGRNATMCAWGTTAATARVFGKLGDGSTKHMPAVADGIDMASDQRSAMLVRMPMW
eukprot:10200430-Heterocapsa_arctica.AAC.1